VPISRKRTAAEKFAADNKNTYGALAALEVAQQYVDKNELDKAVAQLSAGPCCRRMKT
jgi:predicted negative regulator of RcsB-dependent stress response